MTGKFHFQFLCVCSIMCTLPHCRSKSWWGTFDSCPSLSVSSSWTTWSLTAKTMDRSTLSQPWHPIGGGNYTNGILASSVMHVYTPPPPPVCTQVAKYLGTLPGSKFGYELDRTHHFETGRPALVCGNTASILQNTRLAPHFLVWRDVPPMPLFHVPHSRCMEFVTCTSPSMSVFVATCDSPLMSVHPPCFPCTPSRPRTRVHR